MGSTPGRDDVVPFQSLPNSLRHLCVSGLWLQHNTSYFSTVVAYNKALNQKSVNATSTGGQYHTEGSALISNVDHTFLAYLQVHQVLTTLNTLQINDVRDVLS